MAQQFFDLLLAAQRDSGVHRLNTPDFVATQSGKSGRRRALFTFAALFTALSGSAAHAQQDSRSVSDGLRLNVHAGVAVLDGDAAGIRPGLSVAYGNSRFFSAFLTWHRAPLNDGAYDYDLQHIDAGVRTHLRGRDAALVPFMLAAYTWRSADYGEIVYLGDLQPVTVHGGGLTFGAGVSYHVRRRFALEASLRRSGGAMDRVTASGLVIRNEESIVRAATYRAGIGFSWWIER